MWPAVKDLATVQQTSYLYYQPKRVSLLVTIILVTKIKLPLCLNIILTVIDRPHSLFGITISMATDNGTKRFSSVNLENSTP